MNQHNLEVLTNIIGAVESGGQVYGNRRYNQYSPPYHSTPKEHTITIGWACCYGHEAQQLLEGIKAADIATFLRLDTADIDEMLRYDWEGIKWKPNSKEKAAIIAIIDSQVGHKVQDEMFISKMQRLIADCEKDYPRADVYAQMMYCEIRHLGGRKPVNRIFDRCNGDFSLENIMVSLVKDQQDISNSNQVGDKIFWSRHVKCRQFIEQYAELETKEVENMTVEQAINKVLAIAESEVGYKEKKSNKDLYKKTANAGSGNWTKYGVEMHKIQPRNMDLASAWCDMFVDWCMKEAFGADVARKVLCGNFDDYTPNSSNLYKKAGRWSNTPKRGDQIFFKNSERICHTGLVHKVTKAMVYTIEGNSQNAVRKKSYKLTDNYIAGYGHPNYEAACSGPAPKPNQDYTDKIKNLQQFLNLNYGSASKNNVLGTAKVGNLKIDGQYGEQTRNAALAVWKYMANKYYGSKLTISNHNFLDSCKAVAKKITDEEIKKHYTLQELLCGVLAGRGFGSVSDFQKSRKLTNTGKMNADTWYALFN